MFARSLLPWSIVIGTALGASHGASAACVIDRLRPAGTLPTMVDGQTFRFVATDGCSIPRFTVARNPLWKTPTVGAAAGPGAHWYSVALSAAEWASVTDRTVTVFRWTISAKDRASGMRIEVDGNNELDLDRDGWTRSDGDLGRCDDFADRNPEATEICDNGIDEDCNGRVDDCPFIPDDPDAVVEGGLADGQSSSTLAIADVNGDGIGDLLNGAPGDGGHVYVSFGPLIGNVAAGDDVTITPDPASEAIGDSLAGGDADGDGFDDVLVGAWDDGGPATLFLGPITGDMSTSMGDLELTASRAIDELGFHMQIVSDVDGDAENDIVITAPGAVMDEGAVYVIPGATTGSVDGESAATYMFRGPAFDSASRLGLSTTDLGDTDGDGTDDLAMYGLHAAYIVAGGIAAGSYDVGMVADARIVSLDSGSAVDLDNANLASLDYDDDGYRDLLVGDPYGESGGIYGAVHVFLGPFSGAVDAERDAAVTFRGGQIGYQVAAGDCNGDDEPDYLLAGLDDVYLGLGPFTGVVDVDTLSSLSTTSVIGAAANGAMLFAPDWSGDGVQELVVGESFAATAAGGSRSGAAYVYYSDQF